MTDEIVNKEFSKVFKGYDVNEVEEYIETLISLYEQLENENKELSMRCEQLSASQKEAAEKAEQAEQSLSLANAEAENILADAREKAKNVVASAESSARKLLTEVKLKRDEYNLDIEEKHTASVNEINAERDRAVEEAKELIRTTKQNCANRTAELEASLADKRAECDAEIERRLAECAEDIERIKAEHADEIAGLEAKKAAAEAEYNETARLAAEFRERLFLHYSEQIAKLEGFEIPSTPEPESAPQAEHVPTTESVLEALLEEVTEPEPVNSIPPESAAEEPSGLEPASDQTVVFDVQTVDTPKAGMVKKPKKAAFEDTVTMFSIEKEHSGQVHYDSTEISSVKRKLDDIMTGKGEVDVTAEKNVSKKLGFLK